MNFNLIFVTIVGSFTALGVGYFCIDLYRNRHKLSSGIDEVTGLDSAVSGLDFKDLTQAEHLLERVDKTTYGIDEEGFWHGFHIFEILAGVVQIIAQTLKHH
ncbi:MAG: hypothetical protein HC852_12895 [Acaryochloridaceae cyanobacterium RU_4_10]|nr:hypothetical protein [Acaryochloridaceae cyanobacterium RU_4_10]